MESRNFECNDFDPPQQSKLRCLSPSIGNYRYFDDNFPTVSSEEQTEVEDSIKKCYDVLKNIIEIDPSCPILQRELHLHFLKKGLKHLSNSMEVLDASRPWLCYWILHSLELLGESFPEETKSQVVGFLKNCQHPAGGFGGGPGQEAHLAPTYAAICSLVILQCTEAYESIDRAKLLQFLFRMKLPDGSFKMHDGSESDIRGTYCALAVAMLTGICTPDLRKDTAHWISRCQTYEGGFGGVPGMEAHGGYTFCGLAVLTMLKEGRRINVPSLLRWLVFRQHGYEGGFQGRTNKLVDSCYSFWQGGAFPLLHRLTADTGNLENSWLFHQEALQEYLLICCQAPHGGLIDKPGKSKDFYHTCYALSGLSIAQHFSNGVTNTETILGHTDNELIPTHPIYNVCVPSAIHAVRYFQQLPS